jgi:hypothetical protein
MKREPAPSILREHAVKHERVRVHVDEQHLTIPSRRASPSSTRSIRSQARNSRSSGSLAMLTSH